MIPQSIATTIFASSHPCITRKTNVSRLIFSIISFLVGSILLIYAFRIKESISFISMAVVIMGLALVVYGIYRFFDKFEETIYTPTGSIAKEQTLYFDLKYFDHLQECVTKSDFSLLSGIENDATGNIRMDLLISKDKAFVAVQLFQFVPYAFQPITSVQYYTNEQANVILQYLGDKLK